jgi:hypothetical protein
MTLRYDALSDLINSYNQQLSYINMLLVQLNSTVTSIQANTNYSSNTSSGSKTILNNTVSAITSANSEMLSVPSE